MPFSFLATSAHPIDESAGDALVVLAGEGHNLHWLHARAIEIELDAKELSSRERETLDALSQTHRMDLNHVERDTRIRAFFADMDSTMIEQECIDELADLAGVKREIAEITERAMQGELDFEEALRARVAKLRGLPVSAIDEVMNERVSFSPGAKELLAALKQAQIHCVLVSGGFAKIAEHIGRKLGFDEVYANHLELEHGRLSGHLQGEIVDARKKAALLGKLCAGLGFAPEQVAAIGDGANDREMLIAAGMGIAYRAKPALEEVANIRLRYSGLDAIIDILGLKRALQGRGA